MRFWVCFLGCFGGSTKTRCLQGALALNQISSWVGSTYSLTQKRQRQVLSPQRHRGHRERRERRTLTPRWRWNRRLRMRLMRHAQLEAGATQFAIAPTSWTCIFEPRRQVTENTCPKGEITSKRSFFFAQDFSWILNYKGTFEVLTHGSRTSRFHPVQLNLPRVLGQSGGCCSQAG